MSPHRAAFDRAVWYRIAQNSRQQISPVSLKRNVIQVSWSRTLSEAHRVRQQLSKESDRECISTLADALFTHAVEVLELGPRFSAWRTSINEQEYSIVSHIKSAQAIKSAKRLSARWRTFVVLSSCTTDGTAGAYEGRTKDPNKKLSKIMLFEMLQGNNTYPLMNLWHYN